MPLSQRWTVIGIFEEQGQAKQAIDELRQAGFSDDQIGFVFREGEPAVSKADVEAEENTGAFKGGIVGGILGAADALLTPVLGPSVANTIPTATMPVAEQAIDRFQQAGTDDRESQFNDGSDGGQLPVRRFAASGNGCRDGSWRIESDANTYLQRIVHRGADDSGARHIVYGELHVSG